VTDDADTAQARELLQSLHAHVDEISKKVETAETRTRRVQGHAAQVARRRVASLRHELYEAHGLIDRLHRRFPETRPERLRASGFSPNREG
jgi:predicted RNase H-like nuclease (RuvC/YqgF family)